MRFTNIACGLCLLIPGLSAGQTSGEIDDEQSGVTLLLFQEQESGISPYPVRMLMNDRFLRIDEGEDAGDFVLYDRAEGKISSLVHESRTILTLQGAGPLPETPEALQLQIHEAVDTEAPKVAGRSVHAFAMEAEGTLCLEAYTVPGLLVDAARMLSDYAQVLASGQARDQERTPESMRTPCYLARYLYAPAAQLGQGIAIQEQDYAGWGRSLVDYQEDLAEREEWFLLPSDYRTIELP